MSERLETLKQISKLLDKAADRRISQATLDYWKSLPVDDQLVIATGKVDDQLVSVAACQMLHGVATNAIIVTHRRYRNKGYAKATLRSQLSAIEVGRYRAGVAEDNGPSRSVYVACGLDVVDVVQATRSAGTFNRLIFGRA